MRPRAAMQARQDIVTHMETFRSVFGLGTFRSCSSLLCFALHSNQLSRPTCWPFHSRCAVGVCTAGTPRQDFAVYLRNMRRPGSWAGAQEVAAAADLFHVRIELTSISEGGVWTEVYSPQAVHPCSGDCHDTQLPTLRMLLHNNHFWATEPL